MRDLTGKLGKLFFPDLEEKKGRRIVIQIITGLLIALLSVAGMLFCQYQEVKQQKKFQQIKRIEITLPEEIPAFSLCIKDTGCGLKQTKKRKEGSYAQ